MHNGAMHVVNRFLSSCELPIAAALVTVGSKCWLIASAGSPTPFNDQWGAEAAILYPRYFDGTLQISDLIAPHNEHRILMSRLWSLLLLQLNGYWDPILQMLANTLIYGGFVGLFVGAFRSVLTRTSWIAFVFFSALIFSLPFTWGNTLEGFNSQWYFMLLFSMATMFVVTHASALSARWWLAILMLFASYFSMAGGAATAIAVCAICAVQMACGRRAGRLELFGLGFLAAITAGMVLYVPVLAGHAALKAHSVGQLIQALAEIMSWPAAIGITFVGTRIIGVMLIYAPASLASIHVIRVCPPLSDRRWIFVVLTAWIVLQAAALAYGRAAAPVVARNLDVIIVGLPLNAACLLYLLETSGTWHLRRRLAIGAVAVWFVPILVGSSLAVFKQAARDIREKREFGRVETENLRAYLDSGDIRILENRPFMQIPYPDAQRLAELVSLPVIRRLLPPELVGEASAARAQERGLARLTGHPITLLKNFTLRWGFLLLPAGLLFLVTGAILQRGALTSSAAIEE